MIGFTKEMRKRVGILSLLWAVWGLSAAYAQTTRYYVTPDGQAPAGIENAWQGGDNTVLIKLADALEQAKPGDEIWVQGFKELRTLDHLYKVQGKDTPFVLKSGVKLYGGFKGNERSIDERETLGKAYDFTYRSVLSGDLEGQDEIDPVSLIFTDNATRDDNATHVLKMELERSGVSNVNEEVTVVDGFTIAGGHATKDYGGGIMVLGGNNPSAFRISRCFLFNNYAENGGGAIYVAVSADNGTDESLIDRCVVYNNAAGTRLNLANMGGGICVYGVATVVNTAVFNNENGGILISPKAGVVNSTVARNTAAGIDLTEENAGFHVFNTVVWGNTALYAEHNPHFQSSSFHEVEGGAEDSQHNIYVSDKNNDRSQASPFFASPSLKTSFDRDFDWLTNAYPLWSWDVMDGSAFIGKGSIDHYRENDFGSTDLGGGSRFAANDKIGIGAYEYQAVPAERIRYVNADADAGGDGTSWDKAYQNVQDAINDLASRASVPGEVWVAAGTYQPTALLVEGKGSTAAFIMADGISVYGGFEAGAMDKSLRAKGAQPWAYKQKTVFKASGYEVEKGCTWTSSEYKWSITGSGSWHVVWFAGKNGAAFTQETVLDGVTIMGGNALDNSDGIKDSDKGAGVYMAGNAYLNNCIVTENSASGNGGAVYLNGGRVTGSLIYNNNAGDNGGGVYMDNSGLVLRSMVTNNSATNGAGVYMVSDKEQADEKLHPEYLILSTSVVSNNTSRKNGAVYCDKGGVVMQTTLTNNASSATTDASSSRAARTGGLYADGYALVINSVIWKNEIGGNDLPMYAMNPTVDKVRFINTAVSGMGSAVWNNTLQQDLVALADGNEGTDGGAVYPNFVSTDMPVGTGVQPDDKSVGSYYWAAQDGSNLRAGGLVLGLFPEEVLMAPELDLMGDLFAQKPSLGAVKVETVQLEPDTGDGVIRLYVDVSCTTPGHNGNSWATAYRSLNEAIAYFAGYSGNASGQTFEILVAEGDCYPRYSFTNLDPKTATVNVMKMPGDAKLVIKGGYKSGGNGERDPWTYRTLIDGNPDGNALEDGLYHCMTVESGARVEIDGFHVVGGFAAGEATRHSGAGLLADKGADVTLKNCIFENNTADNGAAIDATGATLTMVNCVVNNNTNTTEGNAVIVCGNLTMNHVTVVNNKGVPPAEMGEGNNSFAAGNTSENTSIDNVPVAVDGKNFVNPTQESGATLGYNTLLGGYSSFRPTNANPVVNRGSAITDNPVLNTDTDITLGQRSLGGAPDLGAYEADLPADGTVLYVREGATGEGSSWNNALGTIGAALIKAQGSGSRVEEIWVSAGTYVENLEMVEGVDVLGGFAKTGSPNNQLDGTNRDISHQFDDFKTTIQGSPGEQFNPSDGDDPRNYKKANTRVLTQATSFNNLTTWEGFVITGGKTGLKQYGAGAYIQQKGRLKNCRIEGNEFVECGRITEREGMLFGEGDVYNPNDATSAAGGGGVLCVGGQLENCQIVKNRIGAYDFGRNTRWYVHTGAGQVYAKGAGLCISTGDVINCVIADNVTGYDPETDEGSESHLTNILGIGVFAARQSNFYNCTIVRNRGGWQGRGKPATPGVWDEDLKDDKGSYFYNCIIAGNYAYGSTWESLQQVGKGLGPVPKNLSYSFFSLVEFEEKPSGATINIDSVALDLDKYNVYNRCTVKNGTTDDDINVFRNTFNKYGLLDANYNLNLKVLNGKEQNPCLNTGNDGYVNGDVGPTIKVDANGYNRIQDCTVDIGAYELKNEQNIAPEIINKTYTYYVTQNGRGLRDGSSVENAACAMKLQQILDHAGQAAAGQADAMVKVKIAGYAENHFIYHANTLADSKDLRSYTFKIPAGISVLGGFDEQQGVWTEEARDAARYMTVLSAEYVDGDMPVYGYHVLTFSKQESVAANATTIVDGLYLEDGQATSMAGGNKENTRGGGAIVPEWVHLRNCVVRNNKATEGGGLFVLPGAIVSGCGVMQNTAERGAGIYMGTVGSTVGADNRSHVISSTVAGNTASGTGGGVYLEGGAGLVANTVIWGNTASSDRNVSGVTTETYEDNLFKGIASSEVPDGKFYPFNNCFVETYEIPGNFLNSSMTTDRELYFVSDYYTPRAFSPLIKAGMLVRVQQYLENDAKVSAYDMQGIVRKKGSNTAIDAGAYAHEGGTMKFPANVDDVVKRIFVSQTKNAELAEGESEEDLLGRSFYTSLSSLDDALEYVEQVRQSVVGADGVEFEIWMAEGTYKPRYTRAIEGEGTGEPSQRRNSFVIPGGVKVFGGFSGTEMYSWGNMELTNVSGSFESIENNNVDEKLNARTTADLNNNGIHEAWEFEHQTILSGNVNVSADAKNVYHVIYSKKEDSGQNDARVTLDGLTVMDGETYHTLKGGNELGRGGGIYTNGVDYTLNRCRLLNNKAVRGGAVHALDADVLAVGSVFAGNGTVDNPSVEQGTTAMDVRGGAVYVASTSTTAAGASFKAVNTLWANNDATGTLNGLSSQGGALATGDAGVEVSLMNNTFVRNKAGKYAAIYAPEGDMTNTAVWGNEGEGNPVYVKKSEASASDYTEEAGLQMKVELNPANNHIDGPHFEAPSSVAGSAGYEAEARWNPNSISVLVDAGEGVTPVNEAVEGAYNDWMLSNAPNYADRYMGEEKYKRYAGPTDEKGIETDKTIDIGLYEYQYRLNLGDLDIVFVATQESGGGTGESWEEATSDLRGALNAMANANGGNSTHKRVLIKAGDYSMKSLYTGDYAYQIIMGNTERVNSLSVEGAYNDGGVQDFSQPTVLVGKDANTTLLNIETNNKPVSVEGLAFHSGKTGVNVDASKEGDFSLLRSAVRDMSGDEVNVDGDAKVLIANTLFADGKSFGLKVTDNSDVNVLNVTFAHQASGAISGIANVYNSTAWECGDNIGFESNKENGNVVFEPKTANNDIAKGPNFVDPNHLTTLQRDYHIRPSKTLLNKGSREQYAKVMQKEASDDKDLDGNTRLMDGQIDVGAYEYKSALQEIVYVKEDVVGTDNSGSSWENAMNDLQGAVDLASVYAGSESGRTGYVFVHQNVKGENIRLAYPNVKVYGNMNRETGSSAKEILGGRAGILETDVHSSLDNLELSEASVVDGFEVNGASVSGGGMLSTSIVKGNVNVNSSDVGTTYLYNSIVDGTQVSGNGTAVNVTVVNSGSFAEGIVKQNVIQNGSENGYVTDGYWKYQLKETDETNIDKGSDDDLQAIMTMVGHEKDIAGNKRVRGTVDNGCFETWNVIGGENNFATVTDDDYPHGKSVVYVREGNELRLERDYTASSPFDPGFLLLEHGAGLWGNGKRVDLRNFAAERKLTATNGYKDLVAMPFRLTEMTVNGNKGLEASNVKAYRYNGLERAKYDYKFASEDSKAWQDVSTDLSTVTEGLLFEAQGSPVQDVKLRFYGTSYEEDGQPKKVVLHKYNFNSPWSSPSDTGDKFTHKENMSWNLFGSPYLCTMNYEDMEYGRVVYGYANNGYYTDGMGLSADGERTQGNIPVGSAVFTQSATLKETETFTVGMREANIYNTRSTKLALYVASAAGKRGLEENDGIYDELQLTAVASEEASTEFDLARDGVKWMNDNGEPEIFAVRDGGRYSLLSAIDREGTIGVGVSLPEAGMYSIGIPEDCEAEDYEYVMLKDAATGKAADLKEGAYSFRTAEAGVAEGRFTLNFKRMDADQRHAIYVKSGMGKATVFGVNDGDVVTVVTVDGKAVAVEEAVGSEVTFALAKGAYLFKVAGADGRTTVVKAMVR